MKFFCPAFSYGSTLYILIISLVLYIPFQGNILDELVESVSKWNTSYLDLKTGIIMSIIVQLVLSLL